MTKGQKCIELELLNCESELQYLVAKQVGCAGDKWLGVGYKDIRGKALMWEKLIHFFSIQDRLLDGLSGIVTDPNKFKAVCVHAKSVVFDVGPNTLKYNDGWLDITWTLNQGPSGIYAEQKKSASQSNIIHLERVHELHTFMSYVYALGAKHKWMSSDVLSGSLITFYGDW
jgi:hypothetical protein